MDTSGLTAQLELKVTEDGILSRLTVTNAGNQAAWLDALNLCCEGVAENDVFRILAGPAPVRYKGPLGPLRCRERLNFRPVAAGAQFRTIVNLSSNYEFPFGAEKIRVRYRAWHCLPDEPGFWLLESPEVECVLSSRQDG